MKKTQAGSVAALILGIAIAGFPGTTGAEPTTWDALEEECRETGIDPKLTKDLIGRCREAGVDLEGTCLMLAHAQEAAGDGLPCQPIMEKIAEGVGKGIPPATIAEVARQRVRLLRTAREMVRGTEDERAADVAVVAAAQAMESGLEEDAARSVIEAGRNERPHDLAALLEAGEALYLAGFASDEIPPIITDCLNRRLNRVELRRAVRYAAQQKQRGMETGKIRQALWGGEGSAPQNRHREQSGQGGAAGPGAGGPHHGHGRP